MSDEDRTDAALGGPPALSWTEAAAELRGLTIEFEDDIFPVASGGDEDTYRAAVAHFQHAYTAPAGSDFDPRQNDPGDALDDRAALVLAADEDHRGEFVDKVLFDVQAAPLYHGLAASIRWLVGLDDLVDVIVDRLDRGTDRQRANALNMQYYLFGRADDRRLGDERRARIAAAVALLRDRGGLGPETEAALNSYRLPLDPIE